MAATAPDPTAHRPAILIVEDDRDLGMLMRAALAGAGYRAVLASCHADALVALAAARFALVLADTAGPSAVVADGGVWGALDTLRAAAGDTPVAICTAHSPGACAGYRERGFAALLPKPFDLDALLQIARDHRAAPDGTRRTDRRAAPRYAGPLDERSAGRIHAHH
jgi:DNA-binding NtrC family response regulator